LRKVRISARDRTRNKSVLVRLQAINLELATLPGEGFRKFRFSEAPRDGLRKFRISEAPGDSLRKFRSREPPRGWPEKI